MDLVKFGHMSEQAWIEQPLAYLLNRDAERESILICSLTHFVHKDSVRTSQRTYCTPIRKTNRWILCSGTTCVYCDNRRVQMDSEQNATALYCSWRAVIWTLNDTLRRQYTNYSFCGFWRCVGLCGEMVTPWAGEIAKLDTCPASRLVWSVKGTAIKWRCLLPICPSCNTDLVSRLKQRRYILSFNQLSTRRVSLLFNFRHRNQKPV
jgi:hypothetical protein